MDIQPARRVNVLRSPLILALGLAIWALAGCAGPSVIRAEVTSFHELKLEDLRSAGLTVRPSDEQRGSLEFESYTTELARQFARLGVALRSEAFAPGPDRPPGSARYGLTVHYGSRLERVRHIDYPAPGYPFFTRSVGVVRVGPGGTVLRPEPVFWEPLFPLVYQTDQGLHELHLRIDDLTVEPGRGRVFELRAETVSPFLSLPQVMPALIAASLDGFPAPSGSTRRLVVPIGESQAARRD